MSKINGKSQSNSQTMKKLVLTLIFICYGFLSIAQDNPYEVFGYKPKNVFEDKADKFTIINSDTTSTIKKMVFDAEKRQIEFLNEKGEVINILSISEEQLFRFMAIASTLQLRSK